MVMRKKHAYPLLVALLTIIMIGTLAGCSNRQKAPADPRDAEITRSIKKAMAAKSDLELLGLFSAHPDLNKKGSNGEGKVMSLGERLLTSAFLVGDINPYEINLSRVESIKLKPVQTSKDRHCLRGTFQYSGPTTDKINHIINYDGPGTIEACTRDDKEGRPYLAHISFRLHHQAWMDAVDRAKKARR